jgi:hypothetical protein
MWGPLGAPIDLTSRFLGYRMQGRRNMNWRMPLPANQSGCRAFGIGAKQGRLYIRGILSSRVRRPIWVQAIHWEGKGLEEPKSNMLRASSSRNLEHVQRVVDPARPQ